MIDDVKYRIYVQDQLIYITNLQWIRFNYSSVLSRKDGPAVESLDGSLKEWFVNGKLHRIDGPAIVSTGSLKQYFLDGEEIHSDWFDDMISEVRDMHPALRITDPRWWVRDFNK